MGFLWTMCLGLALAIFSATGGLRLTGIEFDSTTLRVTGEADDTARALVRKIALQ